MRFRIQELTEFPKDIILSFSPESTQERLIENSHRIQDVLYIESMQYVDLLDAYLYAQNEIIPEIQSTGIEHISPAQWENYIKNIHQRVARHLLGRAGVISGEYSMEPIWRWHKGTIVYFTINDFFSLHKSPSKRQLNDFCTELARSSEHADEDLLDFMKLIRKQKNKDESFFGFMIALLYRYHSGSLTAVEKAIIEKIAKPGSKPQDIAELMRNYSVTLQRAIQSLDKEDPQALSAFLASQFYGLTHIHPFSNCNGRTATCLINLLLRAINQQAIVLREPNDRAESSDYTQAMSVIDSDIKPFETYLFRKLCKRKTMKESMIDKMAKELIEARVETSLVYQKIWEIAPDFDADSFQNEKVTYFERHLAEIKLLEKMSILLEHGADQYFISVLKTIDLLQYIREELISEISQRESIKRQASDATAMMKLSSISLTTVSPHLDQFQQQMLCETLEQLSEVSSGWTLYKKGTVAMYQSRNQLEIETIAEKLRSTSACQVKVATLAKDNTMHAIQVTQINVEKLSTYRHPISRSEFAMSHSKDSS